MRRRSAVLAALAAAAPAAAAPGAAAQEIGRVATVQLEPEARVLDACLGDLDGEGRADLVLARSQSGRRSLAVHLRSGHGFAAEPDHVLAVTADVVAFAPADVHADPGAEIVLFNARGAFVWRPRAEDARALERLFEVDFLWQIPDDGALFAWPAAVRDLDGDGLQDLVVPEPGGYRIGIQERGGEGARFTVHRLELPRGERAPAFFEGGPGDSKQARASRGGRHVSVGIEGGGLALEGTFGPLLAVTDSVPAPQLCDWDGDQDLDVLAQTSPALLVWVQDEGFRAAPSLRLANPVERDAERLLDVSYSAHAVELDGDGRADCVIFAGDKRAEDVRTQGLVFVRGAEPEPAPQLFGAQGVPRQVIVLAGFADAPRFSDVDGDGRADLVVRVVRPDLIDAVRAASTERIDVQLYVYRNLGGSFSRRPDLEVTLSFGAGAGDHALQFVGDADGDGLEDLLVRQDGARIAILRVRRERDRLAVVERPAWELAVAEDARLVVPTAAPGGLPEVLVIEKGQVLCASFR